MIRILLVEKVSNTELLENPFAYSDYQVRKIHDLLSLLSHTKEFSPDVIIFNLETVTENLIAELHTLFQQIQLPIIIFTAQIDNKKINQLIEAGVSELIVDDLSNSRIDSIIEIALARFKHEQVLKNALEDARTQFENRKRIDRAKAILIKTQNFSEDKAYHTLRKLAMDRNITLGEMARNVIAMAELLK